jgi:hypothetical protein
VVKVIRPLEPVLLFVTVLRGGSTQTHTPTVVQSD